MGWLNGGMHVFPSESRNSPGNPIDFSRFGNLVKSDGELVNAPVNS